MKIEPCGLVLSIILLLVLKYSKTLSKIIMLKMIKRFNSKLKRSEKNQYVELFLNIKLKNITLIKKNNYLKSPMQIKKKKKNK